MLRQGFLLSLLATGRFCSSPESASSTEAGGSGNEGPLYVVAQQTRLMAVFLEKESKKWQIYSNA